MDNRPTIRVIVVDDHELLRGGIRFALLAVDDIELIGEAHHGEEALKLCAALQPDVVLMDMRLPGDIDGVAATKSMRSLYPSVQVIALSSFFDPSLVLAAMQAGAIGYLVKGVGIQEMADGIRAAHAGRPTLTVEALDALVKPAAPKPQLGSDLSAREREVLALLVEGKSNAQIAKILILSVAAVKYHVGSILSKLGAANRTAAAAVAREHRLVAKPARQND